ncbi:MAG: response regulator [Bacteroidetes bacterium]|nr:response regulator [Bacteroidota bacterium]
MKIILADDERLVRLGLQNMLEELERGGIINNLSIIHAANGDELQELIRTFKPHVAFVDIQMPGKNGLEVIEKENHNHPEIYWVILTGFAQFSYAKKSIELGISEYIVKPASISDIKKVVETVYKQRNDIIRRNIESFENRIRAVLHNTLSNEFDPWFRKFRYEGCIVVIDSVKSDAVSIEDKRDFYLAVKKVLPDWSICDKGYDCNFAINGTNDGNLLISIAYKHDPIPKGSNLLDVFMTDIRELAASSPSIITLFPISDSENLHIFMEKIVSIERVSGIRFMSGLRKILQISQDHTGEIYHSYDVNKDPVSKEIFTACRELDNLVESLRNPEIPFIYTDLQKLRRLTKFIAKRFTPEKLTEYFSLCLIDIWDSSTEIEKIIDEAISFIQNKIKLQDGDSVSQIRIGHVRQAVQIINEKYYTEIGVAQIADELGLTPNYLSTEFKRHMSSSFTEYITSLRMKNALTLLHQTGMTVKKAASLLGYVSSRHFSRVFYDAHGIKPSEYIANQRN